MSATTATKRSRGGEAGRAGRAMREVLERNADKALRDTSASPPLRLPALVEHLDVLLMHRPRRSPMWELDVRRRRSLATEIADLASRYPDHVNGPTRDRLARISAHLGSGPGPTVPYHEARKEEA